MTTKGKQVWIPLESSGGNENTSNPDSFNAWSRSLGLDTTAYSFQDCYGLDDELLSFVRQPVKAVILLFPITDEYEKLRLAADSGVPPTGLDDVLFFKQTIGNACGTMALLHALGNSGVPVEQGLLTDLLAEAKDKTPVERAALVENSEGLAQLHATVASTGSTEAPPPEDDVDVHFVAFVEHKGHLLELDGRRTGPVDHGPLKKGLLQDTATVIQHLITLSHSIRFNVLTLSPAEER